jgi:hypothetical protein
MNLHYAGIFNGSKGTVIGFAFKSAPPTNIMPLHASFHTMGSREIPIVLVKMDNAIGYLIFTDNPNVIPFAAVCRGEKYCKNFHRWQLPLEPAFACTTHKMQGSTATFGAIIEPSLKKPFARGLDYVAVSRPTELCKLFLLRPLTTLQFTAFPKERSDIRNEYIRLEEINQLT